MWYIMDEFGSQVRHSDQPSCGMAPFFFAEAQAAFTVLWPLRDLQKGGDGKRVSGTHHRLGMKNMEHSRQSQLLVPNDLWLDHIHLGKK